MKCSNLIRVLISVDICYDNLLFINYLNGLYLNKNTFGCGQLIIYFNVWMIYRNIIISTYILYYYVDSRLLINYLISIKKVNYTGKIFLFINKN